MKKIVLGLFAASALVFFSGCSSYQKHKCGEGQCEMKEKSSCCGSEKSASAGNDESCEMHQKGDAPAAAKMENCQCDDKKCPHCAKGECAPCKCSMGKKPAAKKSVAPAKSAPPAAPAQPAKQ